MTSNYAKRDIDSHYSILLTRIYSKDIEMKCGQMVIKKGKVVRADKVDQKDI